MPSPQVLVYISCDVDKLINPEKFGRVKRTLTENILVHRHTHSVHVWWPL